MENTGEISSSIERMEQRIELARRARAGVISISEVPNEQRGCLGKEGKGVHCNCWMMGLRCCFCDQMQASSAPVQTIDSMRGEVAREVEAVRPVGAIEWLDRAPLWMVGLVAAGVAGVWLLVMQAAVAIWDALHL